MSSQDTTLPRGALEAQLPREFALRLLLSPDPAQQGKLRRLGTAGMQLGRGVASTALSWALDDPMASREHAQVEWDGERDGFVLSDCGSRNGTRLNGEEIRRERLRLADVIRIGDSLLRMEELAADAPPDWQTPPECLLRGASPQLRQLLAQLQKVAPTPLAVLLEGETGSGKDVVARELHRRSGRSGAYVAVNCAALVGSLVESELFGHRKGAFSGASEHRQGVFQQADGGTLFLDEIGELEVAAQAKLLRVLEDGLVRPVGASEAVRVDVRLVCATNRDLAAEVAAGRFRADLHARIKQWRLLLVPLRERPADLLPIIASVFDTAADATYQISADAYEAMLLHKWPYNVRELIALVRKCMVQLPSGGTILRVHLEGEISLPSAPLDAAAAAGVEASAAPLQSRLPPVGAVPTKQELIALLQHVEGSVSQAARHLGRGRTQVYRWLQKHGIDPAVYRV